MVLTVFDDWYSVPIVKNSQKTVKTAKMTIGVPNRHMSTQSRPNTQSPRPRPPSASASTECTKPTIEIEYLGNG